MAGLGLGPADFQLFGIDDAEARATALEASLQPKLVQLAALCLPGLARVAGRPLHVTDARQPRRKGQPPEEALIAFCDTPKGWRGAPCLAVTLTREHLHARVSVKGDSLRRAPMEAALRREAGNLARKGKPFRKLRHFDGWDHEELPELAPAHSTAFWEELAEALAPGGVGLDVGIAFSAEEARSLSMGDLLGVFRDLSPLYKILSNAA
jgi:uncharacterized protein YktB (UPF0637 family)